jgi:glycosidase
MTMRALYILLGALTGAVLALPACSDSAPSNPDGGDAGTTTDALTTPDVDLGPIEVDGGPCLTTFRYQPPAGRAPKKVEVTGEWNGFANPGVAMSGPDDKGAFEAKVALPPGFHGYKVIVDGQWQLDPGARWRKYVGGIENSGIRVVDCRLPTLALGAQKLERPAAGQGKYTARIAFVPGQNLSKVDASSVKATVHHDFGTTPAAVTVDAVAGTLDVVASGLAEGKHTLVVEAKDRAGREAKPLPLVFWVEPEPFDWNDAILYMGMTDRIKNGDTSNDVPKVGGVDDRANFQNGDLEGVRQLIASGWLDQLGVRALWLTPFNTNPTGAYMSDDGVHQVTGYHGYWPTKAREVDPRLGGAAALEKMVKEAHAHGIRVVMDYVVNHVHQEHEYFKAHPEWFRTGCVCGTPNCDWTDKRLECLFAPYMPDVNWSNNDASEQFIDDAKWWIERFDLDGLRIDAVKHVEDAAVINLSGVLREAFEKSGTKLFLTGETAMGWSDCGLGCNQSQYDTISRYVGPMGLDGQFDFVLYHAVPYRTFATDEKGMLHADYWAQASGWMYPKGSIMTPYVGSHDTPRSVTLSTYRGQNGYPQWVPGNKWSNVAVAPPDAEPYQRHRAAMAWLMGLPGAPLLYYGDEYGEWGGADPNNRVFFRGEGSLSAEEQATLTMVRKLGQARRELVALRRGTYRSIHATEEVLLFSRETGDGKAAIVGVNKAPSPRTFTATLPQTTPLPNGTVLKDRLGGANVTVSGGQVTVTIPARGGVVLAP